MTRDTGFPADVVVLIWERDGGWCARCGRGLLLERRGPDGDWAIHHREPRGRYGIKGRPWVNLAANGVCLCNECHAEVEASRRDALDAGWLVSALGRMRPAEKAIQHARHGFVRLDNKGGWELAA
jgi:hypothetical protein